MINAEPLHAGRQDADPHGRAHERRGHAVRLPHADGDRRAHRGQGRADQVRSRLRPQLGARPHRRRRTAARRRASASRRAGRVMEVLNHRARRAVLLGQLPRRHRSRARAGTSTSTARACAWRRSTTRTRPTSPTSPRPSSSRARSTARTRSTPSRCRSPDPRGEDSRARARRRVARRRGPARARAARDRPSGRGRREGRGPDRPASLRPVPRVHVRGHQGRARGRARARPRLRRAAELDRPLAPVGALPRRPHRRLRHELPLGRRGSVPGPPRPAGSEARPALAAGGRARRGDRAARIPPAADSGPRGCRLRRLAPAQDRRLRGTHPRLARGRPDRRSRARGSRRDGDSGRLEALRLRAAARAGRPFGAARLRLRREGTRLGGPGVAHAWRCGGRHPRRRRGARRGAPSRVPALARRQRRAGLPLGLGHRSARRAPAVGEPVLEERARAGRRRHGRVHSALPARGSRAVDHGQRRGPRRDGRGSRRLGRVLQRTRELEVRQGARRERAPRALRREPLGDRQRDLGRLGARTLGRSDLRRQLPPLRPRHEGEGPEDRARRRGRQRHGLEPHAAAGGGPRDRPPGHPPLLRRQGDGGRHEQPDGAAALLRALLRGGREARPRGGWAAGRSGSASTSGA